jgi:hypothetical protein
LIVAKAAWTAARSAYATAAKTAGRTVEMRMLEEVWVITVLINRSR